MKDGLIVQGRQTGMRVCLNSRDVTIHCEPAESQLYYVTIQAG